MVEYLGQHLICGRSGCLSIKHVQNYKGYKNKDQEQRWIQDFIDWAVTHKNLSKPHYTQEKDGSNEILVNFLGKF